MVRKQDDAAYLLNVQSPILRCLAIGSIEPHLKSLRGLTKVVVNHHRRPIVGRCRLVLDDKVAVALRNELPVLSWITIAGLLPEHRTGALRLRECARRSSVAPGVVKTHAALHADHGEVSTTLRVERPLLRR